jgi:Holliday junction resolvase
MSTPQDDDYEVDAVWENTGAKKRRNSGRKGKRGEGNLAKILTDHFGQPFSRIPQSGARFSQVALPDHIKEAYVGDLVTPPGFRYAIEVKHGYPDIHFNLMVGKNSQLSLLDSMLEQAHRDALRIGREPLLCLKQDRAPWLAFVQHALPKNTICHLVYRHWRCVALSQLLTIDKNCFFNLEEFRQWLSRHQPTQPD